MVAELTDVGKGPEASEAEGRAMHEENTVQYSTVRLDTIQDGEGCYARYHTIILYNTLGKKRAQTEKASNSNAPVTKRAGRDQGAASGLAMASLHESSSAALLRRLEKYDDDADGQDGTMLLQADLRQQRAHHELALQAVQEWLKRNPCILRRLVGVTQYVRAPNRARSRPLWEAHNACFSEDEFRRFYRVSRTTFAKLCDLLRPALLRDQEMGRRGTPAGALTPEMQLSMALRFMAGGSYLDVALYHGVHRATFFAAIWRVVAAINASDALALVFPYTDAAALTKISEGFQSRRNNPLPGCVGALDGIAIEILRPSQAVCSDSQSHYNRKGFFAIPLQAMCDHEYRFLFASAKCTGSTHDSLCFDVSSAWAQSLVREAQAYHRGCGSPPMKRTQRHRPSSHRGPARNRRLPKTASTSGCRVREFTLSKLLASSLHDGACCGDRSRLTIARPRA